MSLFWEFLKRAYLDAYDLPNFYLGIENKLYCHIFTIFFIIALFTSFLLLIKSILSLKIYKKEKKEHRKIIEKSILGILEEKDKNKKKGNL